MTLTELLIASILLSVVFLASTSLYITANRFLDDQEARWQQMDSIIAMEHMARRIVLGNEIVMDGSGKWIKVRWDYGADYTAPNGIDGTPETTADDNWLKYAITNDSKLLWCVEAIEGVGAPCAGGLEVQTGLTVNQGASSFSLTYPPGNPPTLDIDLETTVGTDTVVQHTGLLLRCRAID